MIDSIDGKIENHGDFRLQFIAKSTIFTDGDNITILTEGQSFHRFGTTTKPTFVSAQIIGNLVLIAIHIHGSGKMGLKTEKLIVFFDFYRFES